jgi:lambda repressor-like predicted transcriptional regulator
MKEAIEIDDVIWPSRPAKVAPLSPKQTFVEEDHEAQTIWPSRKAEPQSSFKIKPTST